MALDLSMPDDSTDVPETPAHVARDPYTLVGGERTHQLGRLIKLSAATPITQPVPGPYTPIEKGECDWTVVLQGVSLPTQNGVGTANKLLQGQIVCLVQYGVGEATFTKSILISHTVERRFTVHARFVTLSFYAAGTYLANTSLSVQAAVCKGSFAGPDKYAWTMAQAPIDGAAVGSLYTVGAVLGWMHVIMTTAGPATAAAPLYLLGFDLPAGVAAPTSGTSLPIPGFVSDPLTGLDATDVLSDDQAPGAIGWSGTLYVALSTTTGVYTAPGAGAQVHVDLKAGS